MRLRFLKANESFKELGIGESRASALMLWVRVATKGFQESSVVAIARVVPERVTQAAYPGC